MKVKYVVSAILAVAFAYWFASNLSPKVSEATPKEPVSNLKSYLKKSPFNGYWDPEGEAGWGETVTTNIDEVFPFMGKFKDEMGRSNTYHFLESETVVFKDSNWGELFAFAGIAHKEEKLFLQETYSEEIDSLASLGSRLNRARSSSMGYASLLRNEYSRARLYETDVFFEDSVTKTLVYWVQGQNSYLMVVHQKGQLLLEVAFPCYDDEVNKCVDKVKEINEVMHLDSVVLENITADDLVINENPVHFWVDPYLQVFEDQGYELLLPVIGTPLEKYFEGDVNVLDKKISSESINFEYTVSDNSKSIYEFLKELKAESGEQVVTIGSSKSVYLTESSEGDDFKGTATVVFSASKHIVLSYSVLGKAPDEVALVKNIIRNIRVNQSEESTEKG